MEFAAINATLSQPGCSHRVESVCQTCATYAGTQQCSCGERKHQRSGNASASMMPVSCTKRTRSCDPQRRHSSEDALAAVGSSWLSEPVIKRNTLYNLCAPEKLLESMQLEWNVQLDYRHLHYTLSVTSVRISSDVRRPSLLIRQSKDALWYSLLHHSRSNTDITWNIDWANEHQTAIKGKDQ